VRACRSCGTSSDVRFRFCPWCGTAQRLKIVEYFASFPVGDDEETKGLRVSRYLTRPGHVRLSVWTPGEVSAAVSISESEARRLASFIASTDPCSRRGFAERVKQSADALLGTLR